MIQRRKTHQIRVKDVLIGADAPISIQSMTTCPNENVTAVVQQINNLEQAGCEIVRVAVPTMEAAAAISDIRKEITIPLVADIHFNHKIAIAAAKYGADKVRINPGNMLQPERVREVINACRDAGIPMRVGANSGSILTREDRDKLRAEGKPYECSPQTMVEKVLEYLKIFEEEKFEDVIVSLKASSVMQTVEAYLMFSQQSEYPVHVGITAAGPMVPGTVKSAAGIGSLLLAGIGDTIRVSLTGDPVEEVKVAREILSALDIRHFGPEVISCPTCARCKVNLISDVAELEKALTEHKITAQIKVAMMGCEVNGPGEAREADIGIASGKDTGVLFVKGEVVRSIKRGQFVPELIAEIKQRF